MDENKKTVGFTETGRREISAEDHKLLAAAEHASEQAWAPNSGFHVGAALLLEDGTIVSGNNQENTAYPSGLCAERVAVFYAGAHYPQIKPIRIAVCGYHPERKAEEKPAFPCGGCLQVLWEYQQRFNTDLELLLFNEHKVYRFSDIGQLLPFAFRLNEPRA